MVKRYIVSGLWVLILLFVQPSEASFIAITTETAVKIEDNTAKILVGVTNKGDESAYNVKISAAIGGKIIAGPLIDLLKVNDKYSETLTASVDFKKPGTYPVILAVEYTDANRYPFTASSVVYLNYKEGVVSRVAGEIAAISIADSGRMKVKIKNLEQAEEKIAIHLIAAKEFLIPTPEKQITLKPGLEETVVFDIKNLSALTGSNYPVYAILGYEDEKYHYVNVLAGNIKVEEKKTFVAEYKWPMVVVAIILVGLIGYLNLRRKQDP